MALSPSMTVVAQETVLAIEFDFANPGARSVGFGGAFAGLADDATAAFANPAGLVQLVRPEISLEGRFWGFDTPYTAGGRISGEPTGIGVDTTAGLRIAESSNDIVGVSFASVVYPRGRWRLAAYRHQLANFEFSSETQGLIRSVPEGPPGAVERFSEQRSSVDFEIVSHALAAAYRVTEEVSVGVGVSYFDGDLRATSALYNATSLFDPNPYLLEDLEMITVFSIDSTDWGFSGGLMWKIADRWRLGGFFREGPDFELRAEVFSGPGLPLPPGSLLGSVSSPVELPDVYGLGIAFRSRDDALTVGFEWDRVEYASIVESLDPGSFERTATIDDGDELHLGAKYVFLRSSPVIAVRAGVWHDPEHRLRATDDAGFVITALRQPGDDELHVAAGVGVVFNRVQFDLGVDLSELVDTVSISAIYGF
ncbi:MAG: outer membrane protein transport protein [Acidobacteriota bacterium]|nr:MAG: outer membrane protein transport protein [Acidobacteriota bacterium]